MINSNLIKENRIKNNLTVSDLASLCGVTASYITKLEKGKTKISDRMKSKLIKVFNIKNDDELAFHEKDGTFSNNKAISIHRWYPYIEGFSQGFVDEILGKYSNNILVYDPFNGSGTTSLTCAYRGIESIGSEINPVMRFISNTKVNTVSNIIENDKIELLAHEIERFMNSTFSKEIKIKDFLNNCYIDSDFFNDNVLIEFANIKEFYMSINDEDIRDLFKLALASITVESSNMIRSVDLRRKREKEMSRIPKNIKERYSNQLYKIVDDIKDYSQYDITKTKIISDNAKVEVEKYYNKVDLIITSPPYVNGTNYFRNTKLELWVLDFIKSDRDLKELRTRAITAGINNVSSRVEVENAFEFVEKVATQLDERSPDKRIPKLIRAYFSDMNKVFKNLRNMLKQNGRIYFDIGDSQYYGVHIPVFDIIIEIAKTNGLEIEQKKVLRNRKSKNGMILSQELLIFKENNEKDTE